MNGVRMTDKEKIKLNQDGFIGFARWADDGNLNPIKRAFLSWCDAIKVESKGE